MCFGAQSKRWHSPGGLGHSSAFSVARGVQPLCCPYVSCAHCCAICLQPADYGRHRLWASIAYGGAGPIAGATISRWGLGVLQLLGLDPRNTARVPFRQDALCCSGGSYAVRVSAASLVQPSGAGGWAGMAHALPLPACSCSKGAGAFILRLRKSSKLQGAVVF